MYNPSTKPSLRGYEEIAKRAITTLLVIQMAFEARNDNRDNEIEWFHSMMKNFSLAENDLTEKEKNILYDNPTEQEILDMTWKYEAYWVLVWILGLIPKLQFPDSYVDGMEAIKILTISKNFPDFLKRINPRSVDEVTQMADLTYRYHWASVNARIK